MGNFSSQYAYQSSYPPQYRSNVSVKVEVEEIRSFWIVRGDDNEILGCYKKQIAAVEGQLALLRHGIHCSVTRECFED
jgi:hypothetical protein